MAGRSVTEVSGLLETGQSSQRQQRSDGARTRRRVLDAAVECILELGYYESSSNEIARRAGVTWGVVQYQFGSRTALLIAVLNDRWEMLQRAVASADITGDTLEDRLAGVLKVLSSFYGEPAHLAQLQILLDLTHNPKTSEATRKAVAAHGRKLTLAWRPLFERAIGEAAKEQDLVRLAFGALRGYLVGRVVATDVTRPNRDEGVRRLLVRAVAGVIREEAAVRGISVEP